MMAESFTNQQPDPTARQSLEALNIEAPEETHGAPAHRAFPRSPILIVFMAVAVAVVAVSTMTGFTSTVISSAATAWLGTTTTSTTTTSTATTTSATTTTATTATTTSASTTTTTTASTTSATTTTATTTTMGKQNGLRIVSYNLYWWNAFEQWPYKGESICTNIKDVLKPDILGAQECDGPDLVGQRTGLSRSSPFIGGQGILADNSVVEVHESGSFDIDATGPWGRRYATWAKFTHKLSGKDFWLFNTHWCTKCPTRKQGAQNMLKMIHAKAGNPITTPVVITGDLNAGHMSSSIDVFTDNGFTLAVRTGIDYMFYSTPHWIVHSTGLGLTQGSDHFPLYMELEFKSSANAPLAVTV